MITQETIDAVAAEATRFVRALKAAKKRISEDRFALYGAKETAALRRASMDLSRALSELRAPRITT